MEPKIPFENVFSYTPMAFDIVAHVLTLTYAVMLAALFYFILTIKSVAPRYRVSSVLSVVVMVSAFLLLYAQAANWNASFAYDSATATYARAEGAPTFTNGYRYLNWLIDVPMLLFQILFVLEVSKGRFASTRNQFFFSGAAMVVTGYVGQFYEVSNPTLWLIWGAISTLFFFHVLYLMWKLIQDGKVGLPPAAANVMQGIWWLFLFSWMLYPGAYLMPILLNNEAGVVGRALTYSTADILSKVIYGVLLTYAAQIRSEAEGYVEQDRLVAA